MFFLPEFDGPKKPIIIIALSLLSLAIGGMKIWDYYHPVIPPHQVTIPSPIDSLLSGHITEAQKQISELRDTLTEALRNLEYSQEERRLAQVKIELLESLLLSKTQDNVLIQVKGVILNGDYTSAISFLTKPSQDNISIAQWHFQIASLHALNSDFTSASNNYVSAVNLEPSNLQFVISAISSLDSAKRYDEAVLMLDKALPLAEEKFGNDSREAAIMYGNYGRMFLNQKKFDQAVESFQKALSIYQNIDGNQSGDLAQCYEQIGMAYHSEQNYDQAIEFFSKAIEIDTFLLSEEGKLNLAQHYECLGRTTTAQGQYDKAIGFFENAVPLWIEAGGENTAALGSTYNNIAVVYWQKKDAAHAIDYFKKALGIFEKVYGMKSQPAITTRSNLYKIQGSV